MATVPQRCRSTLDCIDTAREIVRTIRQYLADPPQLQPQPKNGGKGNEDSPDSAQQDPDDASTEQTQQQSPGYSSASNTPGEQLHALLGATDTAIPADVGSVLAEALASAKPESGDRLRAAVCTDKPRSPFPAPALDESRRATTALRTRLHGLLQSQVRTPSRSGRRGRLDTQRLHSIFTGNPRIFRTRAETVGIDTAAHILLDSSGSIVFDYKANEQFEGVELFTGFH